MTAGTKLQTWEEVFGLVRELYQSEEEAKLWSSTPHDFLFGYSPKEAWESEHLRERLLLLVWALGDGAYF